MLILHAVNITKGCAETPAGLSDYEVQIRINDRVIWAGNVNGHIRKAGAATLLRLIAARMDATKPCEPIVKKPPVDKDTCPDCKHAWVRHVERWKGQHQCMARDIDASGNYDGCGCGTAPPKPEEIVPRNRRQHIRFSDLERVVDKATNFFGDGSTAPRDKRKKK